MKNIIEIQEEVKIGNVILEKGDKIKVLKERDLGGNIAALISGEVQSYPRTDDMELTMLGSSIIVDVIDYLETMIGRNLTEYIIDGFKVGMSDSGYDV